MSVVSSSCHSYFTAGTKLHQLFIFAYNLLGNVTQYELQDQRDKYRSERLLCINIKGKPGKVK